MPARSEPLYQLSRCFVQAKCIAADILARIREHRLAAEQEAIDDSDQDFVEEAPRSPPGADTVSAGA